MGCGEHLREQVIDLFGRRPVIRIGHQDRLEHRGQRARAMGNRDRALEDGGEGGDGGVAPHGVVPLDREEQHDAERPQIRRRVALLPAETFRGDEFQ